jgi:diaminopimelate decarboxylase/aspartate kinase
MGTLTQHEVEPERGVETPYPDSRWAVMKFGGTSVASAKSWSSIAKLLEQRLEAGITPVVVHSAIAGVSNALIDLMLTAVRGAPTREKLARIRSRHAEVAASLGVDIGLLDEQFEALNQLVAGIALVQEVSPRVQARLLATGELAATLLGAEYLKSLGLPAAWTDARTLLTTASYRNETERARFLAANCEFEPDLALQEKLGAVEGFVLTQGFIARTPQGETALLGRGGSDTSGAYFAAKLQARRLEIWTDVPGFFSANPQAVPSARLLRSLQYREAQEIASAGGGVLHPRSISPVRRAGIPLFLKCTAHPQWEGTVVSSDVGEDTPQLKAISHRTGITLISMESTQMWHQVGFLAEAFECFREHGISVDLISTSESNVTVSVDVGANVADQTSIEALARDLRQLCRVTVIQDCAAVTLVGRRIRTILHELSPALEVFEEQKVHLVTQAANDLNLTFVVESEHAHRLVAHLHGLLVSKLVGGRLFGPTWEQLSAPKRKTSALPSPWWVQKKDVLIDIAKSKLAAYVYDSETIEKAASALDALRSVDAVFYAMKANAHPDILRLVYGRGLNLECVSPGEIRRAQGAIRDLDPRRVLFTPNFAPRAEYEWALQQGVWVTLDNLFPLQRWPKAFAGREIFVRVDTGKGRGHHEHVRTAGVHSKFGIPLFEMEELRDLVEGSGARVIGLHAHTGSGILSADNWQRTGEQLLELGELFPEVRYIDVGGGLGVPERPGQAALDMNRLDAALAKIKTACGERELWLEPGRFVVAQAGVLVGVVTQTKGKGDIRYVGISAGMNSLIRPALYGAYHEIVNLSRLGEAATEVVTVVGPICETGDRLGSDRWLPPAEEGDVVLIANAGAYGHVMSSHYNLRDPAEEVLI